MKGWRNYNRTGNSPQRESWRHGESAKGVRTGHLSGLKGSVLYDDLVKISKTKKFGYQDWDSDGKINKLDCDPLNPYKQDYKDWIKSGVKKISEGAKKAIEWEKKHIGGQLKWVGRRTKEFGRGVAITQRRLYPYEKKALRRVGAEAREVLRGASPFERPIERRVPTRLIRRLRQLRVENIRLRKIIRRRR